MDHSFMQHYSIFCKPHFSTDHWAEATCPPLLFIVQYLWQGKKQDGAGTHCAYSDYVVSLCSTVIMFSTCLTVTV